MGKAERRRLEIIAMIDEADASLARGEGRTFTKESTPTLVEEEAAPSSANAAERANAPADGVSPRTTG